MKKEVLKNEPPINLLLVDDSPTDRTIFRRHLSQNDNFEFKFDEVENISDALEYLEQNVPDCILLDFSLPDATGVDLIYAINEKYGKNKIPIVMLSGSSNIENAVEALQIGAQDFLLKSDSSSTDILRAVLNAIEKVSLRKEKTEAAASIKLSEERYRLLFDNTPLPAFVFDRDSLNILAANNSAENHFGYTNEEFLEMDFDELDAYEGASAEIVAKDFCEDKSSRRVVLSEQKKKGGKNIFVEVNCHDISFKKQDSRFVIIRDVTEKKLADAKIKKSEAFNRSLIESSPDCVKLLDRDGNFVFMNDNGVSLLEIDDFKSTRSRDWYESLIPMGKEVVEKTLEAAQKGKTTRFEAACETAKGNEKWWDIIVTPVKDANGEVETILAVSRDITDSKLIEQEREKNLDREKELREEAESANRAKDEFLAVISHELRSPLNAMSGWSKILKTGALDEEKTRQAIEVIDRNISLQNSLIEDLLDVSRIISDKLKLEMTNVDFCKEINEAIETVRPLANDKNISLSFTSNVDKCKTMGDPHRIQQIVGNLLTNAIKFTPEGGKIFVKLETNDKSIEITVKDTGIGIDRDLLPHIFDRFQQADASTKRKFGGLGLGLSIVKSLVEMHDGAIAVHSEGENKGTEFKISLPLAQTASNSQASKLGSQDISTNGNQKILENLKILVVEDDPDSLELLDFVLSNEGAKIHGFTNADIALNELNKINPDIIISDISMANMDGFDFIKKLKKTYDSGKKEIPAIAMTAYTSTDEKEKMLEAGYKMHIPKPIDVENLPEQIRQFANSVNR